MKHFALVGALFFLLQQISAQQTTYHTLYFDFDRHELSVQAITELERLAETIAGLPDYQIELQAHTDDRGAGLYNEALARRRADAVRDFLTARGLLIEKIGVQAYGEERPAYANDGEESRQLNRRVDVLVTSWRYDSIDDLLGRLGAGDRQQYSIDPARNTRLTGQQGTTVWIPAGSLVLPDGRQPAGPVTVVLEEAYERQDMLLKGLHTSSGGRLLETGGMIYLEATAGGQPLQLSTGQGLIVALPTAEPLEGMELFNGTVDAEGRLSDWQPAGQPFSTDLATLNLPARPPKPLFEWYVPEFRLDLSGEPQAPQAPAKPFRPHEPRRESFRYNPGFFQRLFTSKETIATIEKERYERALAEYEAKKERYEERMIGYEQEMEAYRSALAVYGEAHAAWEEGLTEQEANWRESPAYLAARQRGEEQYQAKLVVWQAAVERWEAEREALLSEFETQYDAVGNLDAASVNNYFYQVNQLGWINCDRFWNVPPEEKMALAIADDDPSGERVFVVFEELNSIVNTYKKESRYLTQELPRDARIKVIGIKVEDGKPRLAVHRLTVADTQGQPLALDFAACKLGDIRKELAGL